MAVYADCHDLQQIRKLGFGLPIIALTADAMHGDMNAVSRAAAIRNLSKPIDKRALLEIVARYTGQ